MSYVKYYTCKQKDNYTSQVSWKAKKLVAVLATSTSMTGKKKEEELERIFCIWYPVTFKNQIEVLLDSGSEVKVMNPVFASQLGLRIWKTNVEAQKIDDTTLETYGMVVSTFSLSDKDGWERFFEESFLLADVKPDTLGTYNGGPTSPETYFRLPDELN